MNDQPPSPDEQPPEPAPRPENRLTAERFEEYRAALDRLYVQGNISGRLKFLEEWPETALFMLGKTLIEYDTEGVSDKGHRAQLEEEADLRRIALVEVLNELEEKSIDQGALQTEYVGGVVNKYGRDISLLIYAQRIVDKIIPPSAAPPPPSEDDEAVPGDPEEGPAIAVSPDPEPVREDPPMPPPPEPVSEPVSYPAPEEIQPEPEEDPLDKIKPISVEPPPPPAVPEPVPEPEPEPESEPEPEPELPPAAPEPEEERSQSEEDKKKRWTVYKIDEDKKPKAED